MIISDPFHTGASAGGQMPPVPGQCDGCPTLFPEGFGAGAGKRSGPAGGERSFDSEPANTRQKALEGVELS